MEFGTQRIAPRITNTEIGRLTRKIHGQVKAVVSQPPSSGPMAAEPEATTPQTAKAGTRDLPVKVAVTVDRALGRAAAPPTPWMRRAPIRLTGPVAMEARSDPTANSAMPPTNTSRRPIRSPSRPKVSSSAAKITE